MTAEQRLKFSRQCLAAKPQPPLPEVQRQIEGITAARRRMAEDAYVAFRDEPMPEVPMRLGKTISLGTLTIDLNTGEIL